MRFFRVKTADPPPQAGRPLAVLASGLIALDTLFLVVTFGLVAFFTRFNEAQLRVALAESPLPLAIYAVWLIGVAATAAAIAAVILYDFRERWFWRWMLLGSVAWLVFPPVHALIGLVALVLLLSNRSAFPKRAEPR